jgi:hypothetical protein
VKNKNEKHKKYVENSSLEKESSKKCKSSELPWRSEWVRDREREVGFTSFTKIQRFSKSKTIEHLQLMLEDYPICRYIIVEYDSSTRIYSAKNIHSKERDERMGGGGKSHLRLYSLTIIAMWYAAYTWWWEKQGYIACHLQ